MSKRQAQLVIMPKRENNTLVIKVGKVAMGHQSHTTGTGVHDNRPKRTRTRQAQRSAWQHDV
jgi:alpha-D-ribose 1-methylphosphonate 5-triphosphate synthase subunit PhnH